MTRSRSFTGRTFSGPRLATMIMLLGVVGMLMYNVSNPLNWKWVEELPPAPAPARVRPVIAPGKNETQDRIRYDAASQDYDEKTVKPDDPTNKNFRWDRDPDEQDEFARESQVIADGSTAIQPEEMFTYARLIRWVKTRAYQDLLKHSQTNWIFNDLIQSAAKNRGRLLKIPLNVVRILPYEFTDPMTKETSIVYEVWGWSQASSSWLYVAIVPELPVGMPSGVSIREQATFVGYFLKLQGYHQAKAQPHSAPLKAPLLIGRMAWHPASQKPVLPPPAWNANWMWYALGGLFVGYLGLRWWIKSGPAKRAAVEHEISRNDAETIAVWLENADADSIPGDDQDDVEIPEANFSTTKSNSAKNRRSKS